MSQSPIFFDPRGGRRRLVKVGTGIVFVAVIVLSFTFAASLIAVPSVATQGKKGAPRLILPSIKTRLDDQKAKEQAADKARLAKTIADESKVKRRAITSPGAPICAAFYAPWEEGGIDSLRANKKNLSHVIPQWVHLTSSGDDIDVTTDFDPKITPYNLEVIKIAQENGIKVFPILDNNEGGKPDRQRAHMLLASVQTQQKLAEQIRDWLRQNKFQGINLDLEELNPEDYAKIPGLVQIFYKALHPFNLGVSIDVEATVEPSIMKRIGEAANWVVLMDYDENSESDSAGPIASATWHKAQLDNALQVIPREKLVVGIGNYAYDWTEGKAPADSLTFGDAITLARDYRDQDQPEDVIDFDDKAMNSTFEYEDDDGKKHQVWMLDAISAFNEFKLSQEVGARGVALWALGSEDPSVWSFLHRDRMAKAANANALSTVEFLSAVQYEGEKGEILQVVGSTPVQGRREITVDKDTGLIVDMAYKTYPSSYIIKRSGYIPKNLALTFDDGPDKTYTPQILDTLKELNVPATFFVVGANAEQSPDLIRRMVAEGHEIGSHTFTHPNLGTVSAQRVRLELNATQRAIQSITGHSTIYFRPPYYADAEPRTMIEVRPIVQAVGYLTIGESIDPEDWLLAEPGEDGQIVPRKAETFAQEVIDQAVAGKGSIVLLHDAGGDRSETVKALKILVPELEKRGFHFVLVSKLMGKTTADVMPKLSPQEMFNVAVDRVTFYLVFGGEALLATAFVAAVGLGLVRILSMTTLALFYERERRKVSYAPPTVSISVLVAAYNEENVIVRTLQSILASDYPLKQVIVIDDGSKDNTSGVVAEAFGDDPRVLCFRQDNGGKASALNRAISMAEGEVLVCVDADTQLQPDAVRLLARHFDDPEVGAVAGNVQVGNVTNLLTRWQSVEYTTSQNVDRRAYALLNAITVVPGAIGAWRREAVLEAGGYLTDTLAEDMDLTWRLRKAGFELETESEAIAFTEAPDGLKPFFKQRFRWAYGTLQCLWKHKKALFHYGWFGWLALPSLWLFQVVFNALAPFVDIQLLYSLWGYAGYLHDKALLNAPGQQLASREIELPTSAVESLYQVLILYGVFFAVEAIAGIIAYRMEGRKAGDVKWLFLQRFVYRQLMYAVIYRSLVTAIAGARQGWGKLDRKATVRLPLADTLRKRQQ